MKVDENTTVNFSKQDTLIKFLKETKDGKFTEVSDKTLNPDCARITILRQPQPDKFYYHSIS